MIAAGLIVLFAITYVVLLGLTQLARRMVLGAARRPRAAASPPVRHACEAVQRRWPRLYDWLSARMAVGSFAGLPLTLLAVATFLAAVLLGELAEDVAEAEDVVRVDEAVAAFLEPYRTDALIEVFKWITALGSGAGVVIAGSVATITLWAKGWRSSVLPLWVTILGAQSTTWLGKLLFDRARPEFVAGVVEESAAFPSGHATASMAAYGFIAWLIARRMPAWRDRFEVLFWSGVLVLLIGFSRVFLSVHHLSDVAAGLLVGGVWLLAGVAWLEWREERATLAPGGVSRTAESGRQ